MGWFDWMDNAPLAVDQQVSQVPVLPQQQEQPIADQFGQWKAQQQRVIDNPLPVDMITPEVVTPQTVAERPIADEFAQWKSEQKTASDTPFKLEDTTNLLYKAGSALAEPASAALSALSYLDKPRAAIAGTVKAYQDDAPLLEGAKKGWNENTSWKETFSDDFVKNNPKTAAVTGLAADIALDPLWFLTPAKVAKATKLPQALEATKTAINKTETGAKAIAAVEDWTGVNRAAQQAFEFNRGRAIDTVQNIDRGDAVKGLVKEHGEQANPLFNDYVQSANRPTSQLQLTPAMEADILDLHNKNKLAESIKTGAVQRENAFDTFRNAGQEIPNYLLDVRQSLAKSDGVSDAMLPAYRYRDEVLASIPHPGLRNAIKTVGDNFVDLNINYTNKLSAVGRLGDESLVHFPDGSHLKRSFDKYTNPQEFLEDLRKNGTADEYAKAYKDLAQTNAPGAMGNGAKHKVDTQDFAQRQLLSSDTLQKMGVIDNAEFRLMDTLNRASKTLREEEYLSKIKQMFSKPEDQAIALSRNLPERRRYLQIPKDDGYGVLKGQWVPKDIYQQVLNVTGTNAKTEGFQKALQTAVSYWKAGKLANPASIMRNFYSGLPMANVNGKVPFYSLPKEMARVTNAWRNGGKNNPFIRELRETGILDNEYSKRDGLEILNGKQKGVNLILQKGMEAFGAPDQFWRAVVYSHHRNAGKGIEESAKIANKALLDYSEVPEWVNSLSRNGIVPFIKFPIKATEATIKAAYERPAQVTKYVKAQNQVNTDDREKIMPEYMKAKTLLPLGTSQQMVKGKPRTVENNLDLSYILPFANDVSLGNPFVDALQLARTGKNGLGMDVIKPGMTDQEKVAAYAKYGANAIAPAVASPYSWEKLSNGFSGKVDEKGREYSPYSAVAQVIGGLKNVPVNVDEMAKQKITKLQFDMKNNQSMINSAKKNLNLTDEQRRAVIVEHQNKIKELVKEAKQVQEAYARERKRATN